ncbi:hypothetical protein AVEN_25536-1, partial [Araneus ventricosus]
SDNDGVASDCSTLLSELPHHTSRWLLDPSNLTAPTVQQQIPKLAFLPIGSLNRTQ